MRGYAICTERRSGSVFLCRILRSTGVLGDPSEYFDASTLRDGRGVSDYPLDPEGQLAQIPRLGATPNGVYGFKIFSHQFDAVKATRWAERLPSLSFVYLERQDMLGQAMSLVRARQTGQWVPSIAAETEPVYRPDEIAVTLTLLARAQARWRYYFASNGLSVLHLDYEQVMASPQAAADAVGALVGLTETPKVDMARIGPEQIQRDALTEAWRARFIAERRDLSVFY
jgi:LPS sulfotransferase NodH